MLKRVTKQLIALLSTPIVLPGRAGASQIQPDRAAKLGFWEALRKSLGAVCC